MVRTQGSNNLWGLSAVQQHECFLNNSSYWKELRLPKCIHKQLSLYTGELVTCNLPLAKRHFSLSPYSWLWPILSKKKKLSCLRNQVQGIQWCPWEKEWEAAKITWGTVGTTVLLQVRCQAVLPIKLLCGVPRAALSWVSDWEICEWRSVPVTMLKDRPAFLTLTILLGWQYLNTWQGQP